MRSNCRDTEYDMNLELIMTIVATIAALLGVVCWKLRAALLPGIPYHPTAQIPIFGLTFGFMKHYQGMIKWHAGIVYETVNHELSRQRMALRKQEPGLSDEEIEARLKIPEAVQWSVAASPPFVEFLSPRNLKYMMHGQSNNGRSPKF
jgi:hypothetical protein